MHGLSVVLASLPQLAKFLKLRKGVETSLLVYAIPHSKLKAREVCATKSQNPKTLKTLTPPPPKKKKKKTNKTNKPKTLKAPKRPKSQGSQEVVRFCQIAQRARHEDPSRSFGGLQRPTLGPTNPANPTKPTNPTNPANPTKPTNPNV